MIFHMDEERRRFTTIRTETLEDTRLSWKARGLLAYLLTKFSKWEVSEAHLAGESPDGTTAVRSALAELEKYGYLVRKPIRNERGIITDWIRNIYEYPRPIDGNGVKKPLVENPQVDNLLVANPLMDNRILTNKELANTDIFNKEVSNTLVNGIDRVKPKPPGRKKKGFISVEFGTHEEGVKLGEWFNLFWATYPRKIKKAETIALLLAELPSVEEQAVIMAGLERHLTCEQWEAEGGKYIPHPTTFLTKRRYADTPTSSQEARTRASAKYDGEILGDVLKPIKANGTKEALASAEDALAFSRNLTSHAGTDDTVEIGKPGRRRAERIETAEGFTLFAD